MWEMRRWIAKSGDLHPAGERRIAWALLRFREPLHSQKLIENWFPCFVYNGIMGGGLGRGLVTVTGLLSFSFWVQGCVRVGERDLRFPFRCAGNQWNDGILAIHRRKRIETRSDPHHSKGHAQIGRQR